MNVGTQVLTPGLLSHDLISRRATAPCASPSERLRPTWRGKLCPVDSPPTPRGRLLGEPWPQE